MQRLASAPITIGSLSFATAGTAHATTSLLSLHTRAIGSTPAPPDLAPAVADDDDWGDFVD